MALMKTCNIYNGSGAVETVLWTNSSPDSAFSAQTITLSDSIANYDYLKFTYQARNTDNTSSSLLISSNDFIAFGNSDTSSRSIRYVMLSGITGTYSYLRGIYYVDNTHMKIVASYLINQAGSSNYMAIPLQVIGIKLI